MKKVLKLTLCFVLVASMILTCGISAFAAINSDDTIRVSHIEFDGTIDAVRAKAFVRNSGTPKEAMLIVATYVGNTLDNVKAVSGANQILKSETIDASAEGTVLKAFVWEKDSKKVISEVAKFSADWESVKESIGESIMLDGVTLDEYVGGFDPQVKSYTVSGTKENPDIKMPRMTYNFENNAVKVKAVNDEVNKLTEITVEFGLKNTTGGGEYGQPKVIYSKTNSEKYTINYAPYEFTKDEDKIYFSDLTDKTTLLVSQDMPYQTKQTITLEDGETFKKVTLNTGTIGTTRTLLVVKPIGENASKDLSDIFVNADGSSVTTGILQASSGYDEDGYVYDTKYADLQGENGGVSYGSEPKTVEPIRVVNNFHEANGYDWGSVTERAATSYANTVNYIRGIKDESLVGCPYIVFSRKSASNSWEMTNSEVTFWVKQDVEINLLGKNENKETYKNGWSEQINPGGAIASYQNSLVSNIAAAYCIKEGIITFDDLGWNNGLNSNYFLENHIDFGNSLPATSAKGNLTVSIDGTEMKVSDICGRKTGGNLETAKKYITALMTILGEESGDGEFDANNIVEDLKTLVTFTNANNNPSVSHQKFAYYNTGVEFSAWSSGGNNANQKYMCQYPGIMGLYGAEYIGIPMRLGYYKDENWGNSEKKDFYSFKVTEDAEVYIFSSDASYADDNFEEGWTEVNLAEEDWFRTNYMFGSGPGRNVSVKEFAKDSVVTIKSPNSTKSSYIFYYILVKPINSK